MRPFFHQIADYIREGLKEGSVFVHCVYGISRGATAIIAFLIKYSKMTFNQAKRYVEKSRTHIFPNFGFVRQLKSFEREIHGKSQRKQTIKKPKTPSYFTNTVSFREIQGSPSSFINVSHLNTKSSFAKKNNGEVYSKTPNPRKNSKKESIPVSDLKESLLPSISKNIPSSLRQVIAQGRSSKKRSATKSRKKYFYKCRECKAILFSEKEVIPHNKLGIAACDTLFVASLVWVNMDIMGCKKKISCPNKKCCAMLGFAASQNLQCFCGHEEIPGIAFFKKTIVRKIGKE